MVITSISRSDAICGVIKSFWVKVGDRPFRCAALFNGSSRLNVGAINELG